MSDKNGMKSVPKRRKFIKYVGATSALVLAGSSPVAANNSDLPTSDENGAHPVTQILDRWEKNYGPVQDVDITQHSDETFSQKLTYDDDTVKNIDNELDGDTLIWDISGSEYTSSKEEPPERSAAERDVVGNRGLGPTSNPGRGPDDNPGRGPDDNPGRNERNSSTGRSNSSPSMLSTSSTADSLDNSIVSPLSASTGDTLIFTEAEGSEENSGGAAVGSTVVRTLESDFEGQVAIDATGAGLQATAADLFVDLELDSSVNQLNVDYNYNYACAYSVLGSASAQVAGYGIIRDLDADENLSENIIFDESSTFAGGISESDSGTTSDTQSISSPGNYRVGVRTFVEVDAYGPGTVTASVARIDSFQRFLNLDSLIIDLD